MGRGSEAGMQYLMANVSVPIFEQIAPSIRDLGMILSPAGWRTPYSPYACDNGVFGAWVKGRVWDQAMHCAWLGMLAKIPADNPPLWILLPDAVADWPRTVELARLYLPIVRAKGWPVAIALQDGCDFAEVLDFAPDWVFVAGSTQWKEQNIHRATEFFHAHDIQVHCGRVNTARRLRLCQSAGIDSVDGTTLNKFRDATLPLVRDTLKQPCLNL